MTRINLVPPRELMDQHLFAEFREIKMIGPSLRRTLTAARNAKLFMEPDPVLRVLKRIPPDYVLGKGHVSFFYNKGLYLSRRFEQLKAELDRRGINYNKDGSNDSLHQFMMQPPWNGDYTPTDAALVLIRARIAEKIAMKPDWYRYTNAG